MDRLLRVKEKRTYKRFDLIAALAILGCIAMFLFEGIFVFELYDRAIDQTGKPDSLPVGSAPVSVPDEVPVPAPALAPTDVPLVDKSIQVPTAPATPEKSPIDAPDALETAPGVEKPIQAPVAPAVPEKSPIDAPDTPETVPVVMPIDPSVG